MFRDFKTYGVAIVSLLLSLAGCGGSEQEVKPLSSERTAINAKAEPVRLDPVEVTYEAVGTVQSKVRSAISSKATGHVVAVHVKEGDLVPAGAPLVEIDSRGSVAELAKAEGGGRQEAESGLREAGQAVDEEKAALNGVSVGHIAETLRMAVGGVGVGLLSQPNTTTLFFSKRSCVMRS